MTAVLEGVRVLEVAEHTFVPAASALLADWGAEVIKIEHVERGDAMRGLASSGVVDIGGSVHALLEHSNRGKQSLGLDLTTDEGLDILYRLAATADIFLTNKLPRVRTKLRIGVEEIRAANPNIIYVRGTGQGERGPDADKGSYDSLAFWNRSGIAIGMSRPEYGHIVGPPAPGLRRLDRRDDDRRRDDGRAVPPRAHRRGDRSSTCRCSGSAMWAHGQAIALSLLSDIPWMPPPDDAVRRNPLTQQLPHQGRPLAGVHLPAGRQVLAGAGRRDRPAGAGHRPALRRPRQRCSSNSADAIEILDRGHRRAAAGRVAGAAGDLLRSVDGRAGHARGRRGPADGRQRLRPGLRDRGRHAVPTRPRRRCSSTRSRRCRSGPPSSTSTATPSSPTSGSTGTPSST